MILITVNDDFEIFFNDGQRSVNDDFFSKQNVGNMSSGNGNYKADMSPALKTIKDSNMTNELDIIKVLMERSERTKLDGRAKKDLVVKSYVDLVNGDSQKYKMIPLNTIEMVIEALIYASKTAIAINEKTGCISMIKALFKPKA